MTDVFGPVYHWTTAKTTGAVEISTALVVSDLRVRIRILRDAEKPQANVVIYRFYDFVGVILGWKRELPKITPLSWSHRRYVPLKTYNTKDESRGLAFIHLNEDEQGIVYDIMDSYDDVFSVFRDLGKI